MVLNASFNNSPFNIMAVDFIDGENRSIQRKVVTLAMGELLVMTGTHYTCSCKFHTIRSRQGRSLNEYIIGFKSL